jgi:two-component system CheB/CheR fusion protein
MQFSGGEPTLNLLNIVRPELRLELRTALYQAAQDNTNVETRELQVRIDNRLEIVKLKVRPVLRADDATRGFLLVLFEETRAATEAEQAQTEGTTRAVSGEPITRQLEDELVRVKAQLRSTVEQYEVQTEELKASNEELQAMNEELRSAAEELETGKEELQSINEELLTVNQELKVKIEELSQSNNDFQNLMNSTAIGTLFLDRALRVKLFTPHARAIINLQASDVGRPLADITNQFTEGDLLADIENVLERLQTIEREIETRDKRWFLMRALPYRTTEDHISGVVLTFLDITARHRQEETSRTLARNLEQQTRIFNATLTAISDFVYTLDRDGRFLFANQPLLDLLEITPEEIVGKNFYDLNYPPDLAAKLHKQIQQVFDTKEAVRDETPFTSRAGVNGFYEYIFAPVVAADSNTVDFIAGSTRDVTHRKNIELALRESEDRLHLTMESVTDYAILTMDTEGRFSSWNVGAERIFGYTEEEILGQHSAIIFTPEDRAAGAHEAEMKTAREEGRAADERWHLRKNGTRFYVSGVLTSLYDGGKLTGYAKIARDLTEQRRAEEALRRAHEDLERKVEERTHDLAKANEALRIENTERRRIEKARLQLLRQLVRVQDDERRRIARDIHDHLGQQSTALRLKLETLKEQCKKYGELCEPIAQAQEIAAQLDGDVDFLAWELRPAALDDLGLAAALANFVREWSKHFHIPADFHSMGMETDRPSQEVEVNLYRIAQEALNNVCKHAQASRVDVLLERRDHHIVLIVEDDGIGFDDEHDISGTDRGMGLLGMRERAAVVGGTLEIEASPNQGTTIYARLPVSLPEEGDVTA